MKASIIKIGNSQGLRIPKPILEQCGLEREVELEVINQKLVIKAARKPRRNWSVSFRKMAEKKDDQLLDSAPPTEWQDEEWEWE